MNGPRNGATTANGAIVSSSDSATFPRAADGEMLKNSVPARAIVTHVSPATAATWVRASRTAGDAVSDSPTGCMGRAVGRGGSSGRQPAFDAMTRPTLPAQVQPLPAPRAFFRSTNTIRSPPSSGGPTAWNGRASSSGRGPRSSARSPGPATNYRARPVAGTVGEDAERRPASHCQHRDEARVEAVVAVRRDAPIWAVPAERRPHRAATRRSAPASASASCLEQRSPRDRRDSCRAPLPDLAHLAAPSGAAPRRASPWSDRRHR